MDAIPRSYDECRFDAFCKSVLRAEGVQSVYLPGQAEVRVGGGGQSQPAEVRGGQGPHLSAEEGNGD